MAKQTETVYEYRVPVRVELMVECIVKVVSTALGGEGPEAKAKEIAVEDVKHGLLHDLNDAPQTKVVAELAELTYESEQEIKEESDE